MDNPARRRTGAELEEALLTAAWDELVEAGYGRMTMGSVALRARTSEPVLYRRWGNKDAIVLAALERQRTLHPVEVPDTGSLRADLLAQLAAVSQAFAAFFAVAAAAAFSGLMADTGMTPTQVRERITGDAVPPWSRAVYLRARDRGELDLDRVPRAVLDMPFDLVRHDLLMNLEPPGPERLRSIVDELFTPLLASGTPARRNAVR